MAGVRTDVQRKKVVTFVDLVSPNGTEVTVSADRAEALLARVPVQRGDGTWHKWTEAGKSTQVSTDDANAEIVKGLTTKNTGSGGEDKK